MTVTTAPAGIVERRPRPDRLSPAVSLPVVTLLALAMWAGIVFGMLTLIGS